LVLAVGMVVGALAARSHMDKSARTLRLTCVEELADVCGRLSRAQVTVEPAGTTADRLTELAAGEDPGLDGWLTVGPWPAMVDAARTAALHDPLFGNHQPAVAWSPLAVLVESQRATILQKSCGSPPPWLCVASAMSKRWQDLGGPAAAPFGAVKGNLPDPAKSADGVMVLGAMSDELFKDGGFSTDDDRLGQLIAGLKKVQHQPATDAMSTVLTAPAVIDLATGTEADALTVLQGAANKNAASVLYPAAVNVGVEFGQAGDSAEARDLAALVRGSTGTGALTTAGWKAGPPAAGSTTDPGELAALRAAWLE
jgi:hypothetical protein